MRSKRRRCRPCPGGLALVLLAGLTGCGESTPRISNEVYPVTGKVLLANGKPLTSGKVIFLPPDGEGQTPATGEVGPDGTFTLKSADGKDGARAGEYKVRVLPAAPAKVQKGGRIDSRSLPFPAKYSDEDGDTGLTATVAPGPNTLEPFKLVPAGRGVVASKETSRNRD